jgi:glyoxylate/hydroxypyruvate reductase A
MRILFNSNLDDPAEWIPALKSHMPELEVEVWPKIADPARIEAALVWTQPPDGLGRYPHLKAILSLGAGINQLDLASLPAHVPLARLVDPMLTRHMQDYCLYAAIRYQRQFDQQAEQQARREWVYRLPPDKSAVRVGVMGLGELGTAVARTLAAFGFAVRGWARTKKRIDGIACFSGPGELRQFAAETDILICLLPLTPDTRGVLAKPLFQMLPRGAKVINVGRGDHLNEGDLLEALNSGQLGGATLDVFSREPLDPAHPFWAHPRVMVTPHVASFGSATSAAPLVVENLRRAHAGKPLLYQVDRARGY